MLFLCIPSLPKSTIALLLSTEPALYDIQVRRYNQVPNLAIARAMRVNRAAWTRSKNVFKSV